MAMGRGQGWRRGQLRLTAKEIAQLGGQYLAQCRESGRKPTAPGLAKAFGISTATLYNWLSKDAEAKSPEANDALKRVLDEITDDIEQRTDTMSIFRLKQKIYGGYTDRTEQTNTGELKITIKGGGTWGN